MFTVLAAMSGMEREYVALHLRDQEMSLRDIAKRILITTGAKKARHRHADTPRTPRASRHGGEHVVTPLLCGWCLS
ncbi:hypothetical protein SRB17_49580 [Streptomyces sp. RB17]|uniref:hypothetical protein n=1 Tax=Streptomyces sp. RB17 TaxID=2585197 RepID=UPI00130A465E|nr:hypothetical protein [Streptomyces sp. RB17]MQY36956.1 hypothetical protein [Streptomyces sp. RB17]